MDCSPAKPPCPWDSPGKNTEVSCRVLVHGILQARILKRVAISFSRGSSPPRYRTRVSCIAGRVFTNWAMNLWTRYYSSPTFQIRKQTWSCEDIAQDPQALDNWWTQAVWDSSSSFLKKYKITLFLVVLGLHCCESSRSFNEGFSLQWLLLLQSTSSRACRLSSCGVQAWLLCRMWNLPRLGIKPMPPALAGGFLTTGPPGKSVKSVFLNLKAMQSLL